ncbi:MAG: hypothetical protein QW057_00145 [Candidatus Bathyarchaeia archaeon]
MSTAGTIRIKLKIGNVEAEIQCEEAQLKKAVEDFIDAVQEKTSQVGGQPTATPAVEPLTRLNTCRSVLLTLWQERFFEEGRSLSESHDEMSRRGYHYDRSAVAHTLAELVRDGILSREGKKGEYLYVQKRPPG